MTAGIDVGTSIRLALVKCTRFVFSLELTTNKQKRQ